MKDQTFALHDGHYCAVAGRIFGPWPDHGSAEAGMHTEQRRHLARAERMSTCTIRLTAAQKAEKQRIGDAKVREWLDQSIRGER